MPEAQAAHHGWRCRSVKMSMACWAGRLIEVRSLDSVDYLYLNFPRLYRNLKIACQYAIVHDPNRIIQFDKAD